MDVATLDQAGMLDVFTGNGDGSFGTPVVTSLGSAINITNALQAADWNGDGITDLVANANAENLTVLVGSGDGKFSVQPLGLPANLSANAVAVGDFDTNGRPDIVTATQSVISLLQVGPAASAPDVNVFLNNFGSMATATLSNVARPATDVSVDAQFPANTIYAASISNTVILAPAP